MNSDLQFTLYQDITQVDHKAFTAIEELSDTNDHIATEESCPPQSNLGDNDDWINRFLRKVFIKNI